ncbi:MAG: thiamine phosphate synthase [Candidatus Omnitrophica bacterium]|nr:thiamine phosphate synthase [Candidatus Omnitrophota bacterium]
MAKLKSTNLYLVASQQYCRNKNILEIAKEAVSAKIDILQMREKNLSQKELLDLGRALAELCKRNKVKFIVNDDPDLAKTLNADGVHLGQEDILTFPIKDVRTILGQEKIIGLSTHSIEQVKTANSLDLDYIGFGPIFSTKAKSYTIGTDEIEQALKISKVPVIIIGGITTANIRQVLDKGATNIAVIREIVQANNVKEKVVQLKKIIKGQKNEN